MRVRSAWSLLAFAGLALSGGAFAHGDATHAPAPQSAADSAEEYPFGRAAKPGKASRTIRIDMSDAMRFTPAEVTVRKGETVRFLVRNRGKAMHEMVIGAMKDLEEHAALMRKFPGMAHAEPFMAHVAAGKTGSIVWQFSREGEFHFGCLVPGHFEAGMIGRIIVKP